MSAEELRNYFRDYYGASEREKYMAEESNWLYESYPLPPLLEPTRYSQAHIEARVHSVDELSSELSTYLHGLEEKIRSVTTVVDEHLWIAPGFSQPARANLEQRLGQVTQLQGRAKALRKDFLALPRSKE